MDNYTSMDEIIRGSLFLKVQEMMRLRNEEHMTLVDIGKEFGVSRQRVFQMLGKVGIRPKTIKYHKVSKEDKFWRKVDIRGTDECWEWTSSKTPQGYGRHYWPGQHGSFAHRIAWVLSNGEIPEGMHVCHHCDNPGCCNPAHLFLGTVADNMLDRDIKGRGRFKALFESPEEKREKRNAYFRMYYATHKDKLLAYYKERYYAKKEAKHAVQTN